METHRFAERRDGGVLGNAQGEEPSMGILLRFSVFFCVTVVQRPS